MEVEAYLADGTPVDERMEMEIRSTPKKLIGWTIQVEGMGIGVVEGIKKKLGKSTKHIIRFNRDDVRTVRLERHGNGKNPYCLVTPPGASVPRSSGSLFDETNSLEEGLLSAAGPEEGFDALNMPCARNPTGNRVHVPSYEARERIATVEANLEATKNTLQATIQDALVKSERLEAVNQKARVLRRRSLVFRESALLVQQQARMSGCPDTCRVVSKQHDVS